MKLLAKCKEWFVLRAKSNHVKVWLAVLTASEAIFFPLPIDPLLIAILLVDAKKWIRFALLTTTFSVIGAFVGYFVGVFFFNILGAPLITFYGLEQQFTYVQGLLGDGVFMFTLISAVVPIPFKIFVLAAGFAKANIFLFIVAAILGRGMRYTVVAYLTYKFGAQSIELIRRYSRETILIGFVCLLLYLLYFVFLK